MRVALALLMTITVASSAATLYVAPGGSDTAAGTRAAPLASPAVALAKARAARGASDDGYEVRLAAGDYHLTEALTLRAGDSGTAAKPTRIVGEPGARLVGGARLSGWQPFRGAIVQCDLKSLGLTGAVFRELYCDNLRQTLARYPNADPRDPIGGGWLYADKPVDPPNAREFLAAEADLPPLDGGAEVFEFHDVNYYNTVVPLKSIDRATRRVTLAQDTYGTIRGGGAERYFYQNALALLDVPGEWYLDRATSIVYFLPPKPVAQCVVEVPLVDHAVRFEPGAKQIEVTELAIECARRTGVRLDGTTDCRVTRCTVRNIGVGTEIGGWGPWEDCCGIGVFGGERNQVLGCDISIVGGHGVKLTGGDHDALRPAGHRAENNHIHHTGLDWKQGCGARLEGVGNEFQRNDVHDIPRMAVIFGGNDQLIAGNHLWRLNLETCDTGAIYTGGRDAVSPWGSVIRDNVIHDVLGYGREGGKWRSPAFSWGIYLDDLASGVTVSGNLVIGCLRGGVHIHSGRYNRIENNYLVDGELQQIEFNGWNDTHGYWAPQVAERQANWERHKVLPAWMKRFPDLFLKPVSQWTPLVMSGNQIVGNVLAGRAPGARIYRCNNLPYDQTTFERNLLWLGGRPVSTGMSAPPIEAVGEVEMAPNAAFDQGELGQMPTGWSWYARPGDQATAELADGGRTGRCLRINCAEARSTTAQFTYAMVKTGDLPIVPGRSYRLAAWVKASRPDLPVNLVAQSYRAGKYHWAREIAAKAGPEWKQIEFGFTTPTPDQEEGKAGMVDLYIRFDCRSADGQVWLDDVSLREAQVVDEWTAWQRMGLDTHSLVADPLFVDPARGDWRLKPGSPAEKLGIRPLAVERIGCYAAPERASWPLVGVTMPAMLVR
ncbi:MAG: right-handed parallel beta-helix repeat-containing protein [Armatimonadetes bacterium]|nr:right-handed parallel beta-helix repeat-containing protein [Armatimonadota bacterium]